MHTNHERRWRAIVGAAKGLDDLCRGEGRVVTDEERRLTFNTFKRVMGKSIQVEAVKNAAGDPLYTDEELADVIGEAFLKVIKGVSL